MGLPWCDIQNMMYSFIQAIHSNISNTVTNLANHSIWYTVCIIHKNKQLLNLAITVDTCGYTWESLRYTILLYALCYLVEIIHIYINNMQKIYEPFWDTVQSIGTSFTNDCQHILIPTLLTWYSLLSPLINKTFLLLKFIDMLHATPRFQTSGMWYNVDGCMATCCLLLQGKRNKN
jgi:hypothetical protein